MIWGGIIINKPIKVRKVVCKAKILTLEQKPKNNIFRHENTASNLRYCILSINISGLVKHLILNLFLSWEPIFGLRFLWFGLCMAFLALMASKTKNMQAQVFLLPTNPKKLKKLWNFDISPYQDFILAFKKFLAFFQFFWSFYT